MTRTDSIKWLKVITYIGIYGGLLMPLVFVPKVIFPFVFSKLLYFQILIGLTFPAYLILAWVEPKFRPRWVPLYSAIVAYFVAMLISVFFAVDPLRAWWGNQERMNGLFTLIHFFAWFTMMTAVLKTWAEWRRLLIYEVILSVIMATVALLQIPFPKILLFPAGDRVGGLLDNPIYMAAYQIFNLFFIALLWLKGSSRNMKIWLALAAVADIGAFIAAQSRGALLGLGIGIVVFAIVYALFTTNKKAKITVLSLMLLAFVSYGFIYAMRNTNLIQNTPLERLTNFSVTTETRFIAWKIAWQGFLERPLTGWGLDDFHILFNAKYNPESLRFGYYETWFDRAHNTVMDVLSMTGLFGFLTFAAMYIALYYSVIKAYRKKWIDLPTFSIFSALPAAYFMQNLFVFDQPAGFVMSFFMFALIARATSAEFTGVKIEQKQQEEQKIKPPSPRSVPWVAFGILQIAAVILVWRMSVLPARASYYSIMSNNYFSASLFSEAYKYAKLASDIPTPYLDEQTFLQSRNLIALAESGSLQKMPEWRDWHDLIKKITDKHLEEHPQNTHPHFIYARFLHALSSFVPEDDAQAEIEYLASIKTSPRRQQLYFSLGRYYIERGRKEEGYNEFKQASDFDPEIGEGHWMIGLSLMYDLNRQEEGARELAASQNVISPYLLKDTREAVALSGAYSLLGDKEGMKKLVDLLPGLTGGSMDYYLGIAKVLESLGMIDERNLLLGAMSRLDQTFMARMEPLRNGSATSIDESLKQTEDLVEKQTTPASAAADTATTPAIVATSSGSAGPRIVK
ncbi:MAG: O-antigen ligase family protein [Patescibacteria group bacterium]